MRLPGRSWVESTEEVERGRFRVSTAGKAVVYEAVRQLDTQQEGSVLTTRVLIRYTADQH